MHGDHKNFTADSNICNNYMDLVQPRLSNVFLRDSTKPLLQPVLSYHKLDSEEHISITLWYRIHPGGVLPIWWVIHMCRGFDPLFWPYGYQTRSFWGVFSHPPTQKRSFGYKSSQNSIFLAPKYHFPLDLFGSNFQWPTAHPQQFSDRVPPPRENSTLFFQENIFENLVGKMLAIIYWPQYVYGCAPWGWYRLLVTANLYLFIFHIHKQLMFEY